MKTYIETNHLGNVLVTVSARPRLMYDNQTFTHKEADVTSVSDYYPFGMLAPGRHWQSDSYRFGAQGSEKDDEITGVTGSHITTFYREGDLRTGQWWTPDKVKSNPSESPYAMFGRNPILYNDVLGDTIKIAGDADFVYNTQKNLQMIGATDIGKKVIETLHNSTNVYTIEEALTVFGTDYDEKSNTISYDDNPWLSSIEGGAYNSLIGLGHELFHSYQDETFQISTYKGEMSLGTRTNLERGAVSFANYLTSVYSLGDFRLQYSGLGKEGTKGNFLKGSTDIFFNPKQEKISNFNYSITFDYPGGLLGGQGADNTRVYTYPTGKNVNINYTKTTGGSKSENISKPVKEFPTE